MTYRTAKHAVALVPAFLNMILQGSRIQGLQQFETAEQLA